MWALFNELTAVLGADTIAYSTVPEYLRQKQFIYILVDPPRNQRRSLLIKQFLMPLGSIHSLPFGSWLASPTFQLLQSIDA
jgi:adenylate kinase family enzyme